ncbi:DUF2628 domain-containing protein [Taklimakanibacter lacteus]|uniref:DUF2628 domain-containing protein n=1 Tax=Taklimakanibacter lacteus TaxID=2268456 RepID=UPI000E66BC39
MAWWAAYSKEGGSADDVVFLREGFSWWALLFPLPWLAIKGMWIVLVIAVAAQFLIWSIAEALGFGEAMRMVFSLLINLVLGFEGKDLLRWSYQRRGFSEKGLVQGDDLEEAEYRFFTEIGLPAPEVEPPPALPAYGTSHNWKAEGPDILFPGFGRS